jgi:hypothetical protein
VDLIKPLVVGPIIWLPDVSARPTLDRQLFFDPRADAQTLVDFLLLAA